MTSKASRTKKFNVNGHLVECVTVSGLALIVGKSRRTIIRYEDTGILPKAIVVYEGVRYYPVELAKALAPAIRALPGNAHPTAEQLARINLIFKQERDKYANES